MKFGDYIVHLRKEKGLTQADLAKRASMKVPYLSKIENNRVEPPSEEIIRSLASILEVDPYDLSFHAGKVPKDFNEMILKNKEIFLYLKTSLIAEKKQDEECILRG